MMGDGIKYIKFFIDSQAAIHALGNPRVRSKLVMETVKSLNALASKVAKVTIVWIPAHKGHDGNERADELAKTGAAKPDIGAIMSVGEPSSYTRRKIKDGMYAEWREEWNMNTQMSHSRSFYGGPDSHKAKFVIKLARLELGRFIRIITGHNNLNFFQHKLNYAPSPECRLCHEGHETITHLMKHCPATELTRRDILGETTPGPDMKWSVRKMLDFSYSPAVNQAYEGTLEEDFSHD